MTDRFTRDDATPGEDPRQMDEERVSDQALETLDPQQGITHPQGATGATGASSDVPGTDLSESPTPEGPPTTLDPDEPEPEPGFGMGDDLDDGT